MPNLFIRSGSAGFMGVFGTFEIEITDYKNDPANDAAYEIFFDVRGPLDFYEMTVVLFEEDFLIQYFKIPWHKNLPNEEKRILEEKRPLFIRWAVMKIEEKIKKQLKDVKLSIGYDKDAAWAEKVEKGILKPASETRSETLFVLKL